MLRVQGVQVPQKGKANYHFLCEPHAGHREVSGEASMAARAGRCRDGTTAVLKSAHHAGPWLHHLFADGAYAGPKLRGALDRIGKWILEIVKRSDIASGFEVLPRRWVVECTFAWLHVVDAWQRTGKNPSPQARRSSPPSRSRSDEPLSVTGNGNRNTSAQYHRGPA